jgi:hypothetical protein
MADSYDDTLPTDKDWVRFQTWDRGPTTFLVTDNEITAMLAEKANKYLAAAVIGDLIVSRSRGVIAKKVAETTTAYGIAGSILAASSPYQDHMKRLREIGCALLLSTDQKSSNIRAL